MVVRKRTISVLTTHLSVEHFCLEIYEKYYFPETRYDAVSTTDKLSKKTKKKQTYADLGIMFI